MFPRVMSQAVNFSLIPPVARTVFVGGVALGWTSFLCHFKQQKGDFLTLFCSCLALNLAKTWSLINICNIQCIYATMYILHIRDAINLADVLNNVESEQIILLVLLDWIISYPRNGGSENIFTSTL